MLCCFEHYTVFEYAATHLGAFPIIQAKFRVLAFSMYFYLIWFFFLTRAFGPIHTPPVYDINTLDTAPSEGALTLSHSPSRHLKWSRTLSGGILPFAAPPLFSTIFYFFFSSNKSALHPLPSWNDNFLPHLKKKKKIPVACLQVVHTRFVRWSFQSLAIKIVCSQH